MIGMTEQGRAEAGKSGAVTTHHQIVNLPVAHVLLVGRSSAGTPSGSGGTWPYERS